jgi:UDP-N-acetylglucosamine 2-epimerase
MVILDLPALEAHASLVLTDSGGIQEETTYLGTSCLAAFREVAHRQGTPQ